MCCSLVKVYSYNDCTIYAIDSSIKKFTEEKLSNTFLYGSLDFNNDKNQNILKQAIKYFIKSERFNDPLFWIT